MFRTLLIANRGEIACRVIRTARRMGIATVAVYSDADAGALHVTMADRAVRIGPPAPRESYLHIPALLEAACLTGAEAVHPGYGFLSENPLFAEACAAAGLVFVGPPASAMRAMGDKSEAKALMDHAGVPLVPGYHGAAQDEATLVAAAAQIGFPVLIKASAGGGGKGMRVVETAEALPAAILAARREAISSFGEGRLLIERYLARPRHVEIQVFADTHGNAVSLFERDCSVQRRHQKIIEEAPAPGLSAAMRAAMGHAAVAAARAVDYVGAGTVEFIVADEQFHFMEMNTRLQVEHPVTEAITGQDLVEWQLRVAAGERLPLLQHELAIAGHAFEIRLCAEDPARGFLPSVGTLRHLHLPDTARIETGVRSGDRITPDYDPMIAKLIVHGADRAEALRLLSHAMAECEIVGVQTNLALLQAIAAHPEFVAGGVDTGFIGRYPELLVAAPADAHAVAAACLHALDGRATQDASPWSGGESWRLNLPGGQSVTLRAGEAVFQIAARWLRPGVWQLQWGGTDHVAATQPGGVVLDGLARRAKVVPDGETLTVVTHGINHGFVVVDPLAPPIAAASGSGRVTAPIPGRVASVLVAAGDTVRRGQTLLVLEAMKMELPLTAPADGVVAALRCAAGEMVDEGIELVSFVAALG